MRPTVAKRVRQAKRSAGNGANALEQRRSSRLANIEPVEYDEALLAQADAACDQTRPCTQSLRLQVSKGAPSLGLTLTSFYAGARSRCEEVYTAEHVDALGNCEEEWCTVDHLETSSLECLATAY